MLSRYLKFPKVFRADAGVVAFARREADVNALEIRASSGESFPH